MPKSKHLRKPSLVQVKRAARDNWLKRNQPKPPKKSEHPHAHRLFSQIPNKG